jgi:hypothetical protein
MAAGDYLFQVLPVLGLVLKRPAAAPGDPDPVELRLLEQAEHLIEIAVIDVGQHLFLFSAELLAPPGPLGFPALDSSAVQPDETKISLFRPRRHVLRLGPIQSGRRVKRLGGREQQGGGDQANQSNVSYASARLRAFLPAGIQAFPVIIIITFYCLLFSPQAGRSGTQTCLNVLD